MKFLINLFCFFFLFCLSQTKADPYIPPKNVQVVVSYGPGSTLDLLFRRLEQHAKKYNISMTPQYKPGAFGLIGTQAAYTSDSSVKDSTIGITLLDAVVLLNQKTKVDADMIIPIQKSIFAVMAQSDSKAQNTKDLLNSGNKDRPLKIGIGAAAARAFITTIIKQHKLNYEPVLVPYKNPGEILLHIANKELDAGVSTLFNGAAFIKDNRVRLIATDSTTTLPEFPYAENLNLLDKNISNINGGVVLILPQNSSQEQIKFWKKFISDYHNDVETKQNSRENYWNPVNKTSKELERDLVENYSQIKIE